MIRLVHLHSEVCKTWSTTRRPWRSALPTSSSRSCWRLSTLRRNSSLTSVKCANVLDATTRRLYPAPLTLSTVSLSIQRPWPPVEKRTNPPTTRKSSSLPRFDGNIVGLAELRLNEIRSIVIRSLQLQCCNFKKQKQRREAKLKMPHFVFGEVICN